MRIIECTVGENKYAINVKQIKYIATSNINDEKWIRPYFLLIYFYAEPLVLKFEKSEERDAVYWEVLEAMYNAS